MSPDKKLDWFRQRGWTTSEVAEVHKLVVDRFNNLYPATLSPPAPPTATSNLSLAPGSSTMGRVGFIIFMTACLALTCVTLLQPRSRSRYLTEDVDVAICPADSIKTFLDDPVVPTSLIVGQGGVMKYWYHFEEPTPWLSRMGSDFLSAPGMSSFYVTFSDIDLSGEQLPLQMLSEHFQKGVVRSTSCNTICCLRLLRQRWLLVHGMVPR